MPTEEERWRAQFNELGLTEVRRQIATGGYPIERHLNAALRWSLEEERAELNRAETGIRTSRAALGVAVLSLLVAVISLLVALFKG
jgi:hypothetical protein